MELHRSNFSIVSALGKGTTVTASLPANRRVIATGDLAADQMRVYRKNVCCR